MPLLRGHPSRRSHESDFTLPAEGWGQVILSSSSPRVGSGWTDSGKSDDSRGLKKRARTATRGVPIPPALVSPIRDHIAEFGTAEDGRLFPAARGGGLLSKEYDDVWKAARRAVRTKQEVKTPPAEVARRAGHSIALLFRFCAKAIRCNQQHANSQIERALEAE
ncbi:hypothetical protein ACWF95_38865 [Streptomyces vinaceus]